MARAALLQMLRSQSKPLSPRNFHSGYQVCRFVGRSFTPKVNFYPAIQVAAAQKRWENSAAADHGKMSNGPRGRGKAAEDEKDTVVYYGSLSSTIEKLKLQSSNGSPVQTALGWKRF